MNIQKRCAKHYKNQKLKAGKLKDKDAEHQIRRIGRDGSNKS